MYCKRVKEIRSNLVDVVLAISALALVIVGGYWLYNKGKNTHVYTGITPPGTPSLSATPGQPPQPISGQ